MSRKQKVMMLVIILLACNMRAPFTGVGALTALIRADLGISNTVTGLLTTIPMLVFAVISPLVAGISRRFGLGRTLTAALCLILAGEAVRSYTGPVGLFLGTGLLCVGIGLLNVLVISLIKQQFPDNPAPATSAYSTTMALTSALAIGSSVWLAQGAGLGWQGALMVWGVVAVAALAAWIPQSRLKEGAAAEGAEEDCLRPMLRSPRTWQLAVFMGTQCIMFYCMNAWGPTILQSKGFTLEASSAAATFLQVTSLPMTMFAPLLARRFPVKKMLIVLNTMFLVGLGLYYLSDSVPLIYLGMLLYAQGMGSMFSFCLLFYSQRTRTAAQAATLSGIAQCGGYLLSAVGPVLMGRLADVTGGWDLPVLFLFVVLLVNFASSLLSGRDGSILE